MLTVEAIGPCEEWTGYRGTHGYGVRKIKGHTVLTHRLAWETANGPIPPSMRVLHRCDNPPCIRVSHLFLGTQADNIQDMTAKGRGRWPNHRGSKIGTSKLTETKVAEIKVLLAAGHRQPVVAARFGVSPDTISLIHRGKAWRHVEVA